MKLSISFFDTKMIEDILQRIGDYRRIENFLTSTSLNILFSMINLIVFSIVLAIYSMKIFIIFLIGSIIYTVWILIFLKKRKELDYKRFSQLSDNQSNLIQLITGMQEIKLNSCEKQKRWEWEHIQAKLFNINVKSLSVNQFQQAGTLFINEGQKQRILIARAVYKSPEYLFFDEATNALDANNERIIIENLEESFEGKTVIIVAHRLSTEKKADQIVVLDKGQIVEQGTHTELTKLKGIYYKLVKNQLELGN